MKQYLTVKKLDNNKQNNLLLKEFNIDGVEIFGDDYLSRTEILNMDEKKIKRAIDSHIKRIHCSYWAYPTSFLNKINFKELIERFSSINEVTEYYGDLTGKHMFERWIQEYKFAKDINAKSYVFHLIDYAPIDGRWEFTISKKQILNSMLFMIQQFVILLLEKNLIDKQSPLIEIENAGWGLEYGVQTAEDFSYIFKNLYDPFNKVKVSWDINHLLHALGLKNKKPAFLLPKSDMNDFMIKIDGSKNIIEEWIEHNLLHPETINRTACIHLSDCALKDIEYFVKGQFIEPYLSEIKNLKDQISQEDYGVKVVLKEYDSHLPLGKGCLTGLMMRPLIKELENKNKDFFILHELKNSTNIEQDLLYQMNELGER